jgi:H+/Cl- antiporter ClcA
MQQLHFLKSTWRFSKGSTLALLRFFVQWILIACILGFMVGSSTAFFLVALEWVTQWRGEHLWIIDVLPLAGLVVGLTYYYWGKGVEDGNRVLMDTAHHAGKKVPFKMAPLVLWGTLVTHLFGGSAGREGTAVQMGGAIADQFTPWFKFTTEDRKILLTMGMSAGFAAVFGTPLAGAVFGLEVLFIGKMRYQALFPALIAALAADYVTQQLWGVGHTQYAIDLVPAVHWTTLLYALIAGITFGVVAMIFVKTTHTIADGFKHYIKHPILRPVIGGVILSLAFFTVYRFMDHTTRYAGLGIPTIVESFQHPVPSYDFILKLLFTAFTIGCGFKGGEVTPLFFIGATLGSALSLVLPLPTALLAGMGFVAVFAGAANTPITCILMAMELFGAECGIYVGIACIVAYLFSGQKGIYTAQVVDGGKYGIREEID